MSDRARAKWAVWIGKSVVAAAVVLAMMIGIGIGVDNDGAAAATTNVLVGERDGVPGSADNEYNARDVAIFEGDSVQWDWFDGTHNIAWVGGAFPNTAITYFDGVAPDSWTETFPTAGTYLYYCTLHATAAEGAAFDATAMTGRVVVSAAPVDSNPPITSGVGVSPDPTDGAAGVTLTATVDDSATGGSTIVAAEYTVGATAAAAGSGTSMSADDGSFSSSSEVVTASVNVSALGLGTHTVWVRGQDAGNGGTWGAAVSSTFEVTATPAGSVPATIAVNAGALSQTSSAVDFGAITVTGVEQIVDTQPAVAYNGTDARGNAAGWNITMSSTDFSAPGGTIPVANFKMQVLPGNIVTNGGNTAPTSLVQSYQPLSGSPLKVLTAGAGDGMGDYDYTPDFRLTVPASVISGSYQANMTISINSGP
jgi:plastocyanin